MSVALKAFEAKYGTQAAAEVVQLLSEAREEELTALVGLRDSLVGLLSFRREAILGATQVQQTSFQNLLARLRQRPSILLVYKSEPAAVVVNPKVLEDVEERLSAVIAAMYWEAHEGQDVSPEDFWRAMDEIAPRGRN
ncbi:hypothetical protein LIP_2352 [Limnochorda pilosa]|uniref:Uncharacterized protein n=1 Tax=Limnochorda pilosa TaxID=1555112 RepID=A0A0K2SM53_LIMPI|nr:hypothetical protein LIP_2352 [Limnochorda pilosa]